jgi:ELWxxDGT repeat protein
MTGPMEGIWSFGCRPSGNSGKRKRSQKKLTKRSSFASDSYYANTRAALFFTAYDSIDGNQLWKSDGTAAGTVMVTDINPDNGGFKNVNFLQYLNGALYFNADDGTNGTQLWQSDGTPTGTVMISDVVSPVSSNPSSFISYVPAPLRVASVSASPAIGDLDTGHAVTLTLVMSEAAIVSGGVPTLILNDGRSAAYDAAETASLGDPTKLVFDYVVQPTMRC